MLAGIGCFLSGSAYLFTFDGNLHGVLSWLFIFAPFQNSQTANPSCVFLQGAIGGLGLLVAAR